MVTKCAIPACSQKWAVNTNLSFHKFPVDKKKFKLWMSATKLSKLQVKSRTVICSSHFMASDYHYGPNFKKCLNRDAVPNLDGLKRTSIKKSNSEKTKNVRSNNNCKVPVRKIKIETEVNKTKTVKSNSEINKAKSKRSTSLSRSSHELQKNNSRKSVNRNRNTTVKESVSNDTRRDKKRKRDESVDRIRIKVEQKDSKSRKRTYSEESLPVLKKFKLEDYRISKVNKRNIPRSRNKKPLRNETSTNTVSSSDKRYWTSIQETITEMQEKIKSLESKSLRDEKKIENFQKILTEQKKGEMKGIFGGKEKEHLLRMDALCLNYDPKRMCRLCLLEKIEPLIPLFQPRRKSQLIEKIKIWTGIEVQKDDGMPNSICYECSIQMERAHWFKKRSGNADVLMKKFIHMKKTANTMRELTRTHSFYQEEDEEQNQYQTEPFPGVKIEIEDVFSLENVVEEPSFEVSVKEEVEDISYVEDSEMKALNNFNETAVAVDLQQILQCVQSKIKYCRYCNKPVYKCAKKNSHGVQCFECGKVFWDREALRRHRILRFACISCAHERTCHVCNAIFRWKWQFNIHYWQHSKIKTHSCMICGEQFTYIKQLKVHVSSHFS